MIDTEAKEADEVEQMDPDHPYYDEHYDSECSEDWIKMSEYKRLTR